MTTFLAQNLKYLRLRKQWSQKKAGQETKLNPSTISSYENGRTMPKLLTLLRLGEVYNRGLDELMQTNFAETDMEMPTEMDGRKIRILPIMVNKETDKERVALVPVSASAGYMRGYSDAEFVAELPQFSLPFSELSKEMTYRVFQIEGDSMLPIPSGAYIICEYLQNWNDLSFGEPYVILTKDDGVVFKRPMPTTLEQVLSLHSDNKMFEPFEVEYANVMEIWKAKGYVSFDLGDTLKEE